MWEKPGKKEKKGKKKKVHIHNTKNQALQEMSQIPLEADFISSSLASFTGISGPCKVVCHKKISTKLHHTKIRPRPSFWDPQLKQEERQVPPPSLSYRGTLSACVRAPAIAAK